MQGFEIDVQVGEVTLDTVIGQTYEGEPMTLGDAVLGEIASTIVKDKDVYPSLRDLVNRIRDELIREKLEPVIEAALNEPFRQSNPFGEPYGEPVTLRKLVHDQATALLTAKDNNRGAYGDREKSLLKKLIDEQVNSVLKRELEQAVADEKKKLLGAMRGKAAEVLTEVIERGVRL